MSLQKQSREEESNSRWLLSGLGASAALVGAGFLITRYKISKPEQFLVRTGLGIKDMSISRTAIVWPFQDCVYYFFFPTSFRDD